MSNSTSATGRSKSTSVIGKLGMPPLILWGLLEAPYWIPEGLPNVMGGRLLVGLFGPAGLQYHALRTAVLANPGAILGAAAGAGVLGLVGFRALMKFWHNELKARLSGTHFAPESTAFPNKQFDVLEQLNKRPKGSTFLGMEPQRGLFGRRWKPLYLTAQERSMHVHVLGKTGSGKTKSVIWPMVAQDAMDGRGAVVMDAKGSDENVRTMKAIAAMTGRQKQLKVFCLPAWNQPHLFSHTYNMVEVRRRTANHPGGDPVVVGERVFSVLPMGDNDYYNTQAQVMFTNLCRLLHGMVDEGGNGIPFVMRDLAVCLRGIGAQPGTGYGNALRWCLASSVERDAAAQVDNQIERLGTDVRQCFSGLIGAVDRFLSPLVNAYAPDIVFEELLQRGELLYVQLPGNLFKIQAPAVGKAMLMDIQQEGSLRQVFRDSRSQEPFSVFVDEFYNFADLSIIDSLNKLRDAHLQFTLAHQSIADLELVGKEFATAVWDNSPTKIILNQDNPELCEKVSKSIGTHQVIEKTVRQAQGALFTSLNTGDASTKLIETFILHPNAIKSLAPCGQGYCHVGQKIVPLAFSMLPDLEDDYELGRNCQAGVPGLRLEEKFLKPQ